MDEHNIDKKRIILSFVFPVVFLLLLWAIKFIEVQTGNSFVKFGLHPMSIQGLPGVLTGPLIHGDYMHLIDNSVPVFVLLWSVFYFYKEIAWKVFVLIYLLSQLWLWFFARGDVWHIGASGVIYGLSSFLFVSGIIRKNRHLLAISMLVVFLYGSLIWGIFPIKKHISWEGHFMGLVAGIIVAYYYRDFGPQKPEDEFEDDEDDENETDWYYYSYIEKEKTDKKDDIP